MSTSQLVPSWLVWEFLRLLGLFIILVSVIYSPIKCPDLDHMVSLEKIGKCHTRTGVEMRLKTSILQTFQAFLFSLMVQFLIVHYHPFKYRICARAKQNLRTRMSRRVGRLFCDITSLRFSSKLSHIHYLIYRLNDVDMFIAPRDNHDDYSMAAVVLCSLRPPR